MELEWSKSATWSFLLLTGFTTIVYMSGLAALQADCYTIPSNPTRSAIFGRSVFGASDFQCCRMFRFYWFTFAFVMATLIGLAIATGSRLALHFSRPFWVGMVTINIVLMMIASEFFLGHDVAFDDTIAWYSWMHVRWMTATAGAIMTVISLILLPLAVGTDWDRYGYVNHHQGLDAKGYPTITPTTTPMAGTVPVAAPTYMASQV